MESGSPGVLLVLRKPVSLLLDHLTAKYQTVVQWFVCCKTITEWA